MPLTVHAKASTIKWTAVVRNGHGSRSVESAACGYSRGEQLAIRRRSCAVQDVKTQNVRRAVWEVRRAETGEVSGVGVKRHNRGLELAGFRVDGHGHARGIIAWSEGAVSCIVCLQGIRASRQKGGLEGCSAGAEGCSSYASVHRGRGRE